MTNTQRWTMWTTTKNQCERIWSWIHKVKQLLSQDCSFYRKISGVMTSADLIPVWAILVLTTPLSQKSLYWTLINVWARRCICQYAGPAGMLLPMNDMLTIGKLKSSRVYDAFNCHGADEDFRVSIRDFHFELVWVNEMKIITKWRIGQWKK